MRIAGQTMPLVGEEYVLFLKRYSDEDAGYLLETGYRIKNGASERP